MLFQYAGCLLKQSLLVLRRNAQKIFTIWPHLMPCRQNTPEVERRPELRNPAGT